MVGTFEDDVRGKGGRNSWSYGGNGPSRKSRENQLKKRWTGDRESHPWWMRDSEGNIDPSKPAVHFVHDDEVHAASEGSASTPDNSIRDTIWKDDNGTSRRSRVGKGEDARGGGGGGREGREKDFRTRHLRGDSGSSRYHGYMHSSWQLHNENNHQYSAQYLGSSSSFSSPPQLQTETPVDNQKSLSSTIEVFRRHDDAVELEFFIKAAIACAVLMGFLLWFSVKFWCITKARRGQRRAGRGLQHNNRRVHRPTSLDSQFSGAWSMTSSGVISDASATVAECFAGTGDDADATQFFNPMWAGAIDQEDSTLRYPSTLPTRRAERSPQSSDSLATRQWTRRGPLQPQTGISAAAAAAAATTTTTTQRGVCSYTADDFPMPGFKRNIPKPPLAALPPPNGGVKKLGRERRPVWNFDAGRSTVAAQAQVYEVDENGERRSGTAPVPGVGVGVGRGSGMINSIGRERSEASRHMRPSTASYVETACFKDDS